MTKGLTRGIGTDRVVTRRSVLQAGAGIAGLAASGGFAFPRPAVAQASGFDWKRFKGEHLEVLMAKGPRGDLLQQYRKEFEALTGMTVGDEQVPEQQQRQKTAIEFNSGNTSFDVVMIPYHVQKVMFGKNKWLVDLRPYLADLLIACPDVEQRTRRQVPVRALGHVLEELHGALRVALRFEQVHRPLIFLLARPIRCTQRQTERQHADGNSDFVPHGCQQDSQTAGSESQH